MLNKKGNVGPSRSKLFEFNEHKSSKLLTLYIIILLLSLYYCFVYNFFYSRFTSGIPCHAILNILLLCREIYLEIIETKKLKNWNRNKNIVSLQYFRCFGTKSLFPIIHVHVAFFVLFSFTNGIFWTEKRRRVNR